MPLCEKCGNEFEEWDAEYEFENGVDTSFPVSYDQLNKYLCGKCAIEEFKNGNYYETCECCGKRFNPDSEQFEFEKQVSHKVLDADMFDLGIHCADCAATKLLCSLENQESEFEEEFLNVYDAALIWVSHGKDEDYMFGYTEEELEDAL